MATRVFGTTVALRTISARRRNASSRFFSEVARAYEAELGQGVPVMVNFNNFLGRFYQPGPVGNNKDKQNPNAAMGQHDWLEFGR